MERVLKRIGIASVAFISVCLIIAIIIVNIKYNKYFKIIELDMTEQYITDWGTVSINGAKILNKDDFITEYTGVEPYIFDADIYEEGENVRLMRSVWLHGTMFLYSRERIR